MMLKVVKGLKNGDKVNILPRVDGRTKGYMNTLKKTRYLKNVMKFSFPNICIDAWNELDKEPMCGRNS